VSGSKLGGDWEVDKPNSGKTTYGVDGWRKHVWRSVAVHLWEASEGAKVLLRLGVHNGLGVLSLRRGEGRLLRVLSAVK
jgi:hypothetical protein